MPLKGAAKFCMFIFPHIRMVCIYTNNFVKISKKNRKNVWTYVHSVCMRGTDSYDGSPILFGIVNVGGQDRVVDKVFAS